MMQQTSAERFLRSDWAVRSRGVLGPTGEWCAATITVEESYEVVFY